jgi:hypothetical protein
MSGHDLKDLPLWVRERVEGLEVDRATLLAALKRIRTVTVTTYPSSTSDRVIAAIVQEALDKVGVRL